MTQLTKEALYDALKSSGMSEKEFWRVHMSSKMTYNTYHSRVYRRGLELENERLKQAFNIAVEFAKKSYTEVSSTQTVYIPCDDWDSFRDAIQEAWRAGL